MICPPCRNDRHKDCLDQPRQHAQDAGEIVAVAPNTSMWCYCAHRRRVAAPEPQHVTVAAPAVLNAGSD